jgi:hypothetical protein
MSSPLKSQHADVNAMASRQLGRDVSVLEIKAYVAGVRLGQAQTISNDCGLGHESTWMPSDASRSIRRLLTVFIENDFQAVFGDVVALGMKDLLMRLTGDANHLTSLTSDSYDDFESIESAVGTLTQLREFISGLKHPRRRRPIGFPLVLR